MSSIPSRIREISISVSLFVRETRSACLISPRKFVATSHYVPHICLINYIVKYTELYENERCLRLSELVKIISILFLSCRMFSARARLCFYSRSGISSCFPSARGSSPPAFPFYFLRYVSVYCFENSSVLCLRYLATENLFVNSVAEILSMRHQPGTLSIVLDPLKHCGTT